jgi:hypothetical protein
MLIGSMVLLFVLTLIFRDMPPLMFYTVTLILGIALVTWTDSCAQLPPRDGAGSRMKSWRTSSKDSVRWSSTSS